MKIQLVCINEVEGEQARTVVLATSEVVDATGSVEVSYLNPNTAAIQALPTSATERTALLCAAMLGEFLPFAGKGSVITRMREAYQAQSTGIGSRERADVESRLAGLRERLASSPKYYSVLGAVAALEWALGGHPLLMQQMLAAERAP